MRMSIKLINLHQDALHDFDRIQSALWEERKQSLQDRRFYSLSGGQWEGTLGEQYANKPKYEVNKVHLSVIKIFNEYRNNRVTVDYVAKDGSPDDGLADTCDGLYRADEQDSNAEEAYDNAFEEAVGGGIGAFRLTTEYEDQGDEENEKQRIRIEPIYDADSSVFFDLDAKRQDKSDAQYCFVIHSMTHDGYREEYDKEPVSLGKEISDVEYDWYTPDLVYVAEYYRVEMKKVTYTYFQTITGEEVRYSAEELEDDSELQTRLESQGAQLVRTRTIREKRVHKYIFDGNEMLEDCGYIAGTEIPIIPVYGKRWFVDGIERCMGHVRLAKDMQRIKNMLVSKLAEISSLSSVEKPIFLPEQIAGHEASWANDNIENYPFQLINPIEDPSGGTQPAGPVGYTKPPVIPDALAALMQIADVDMKELLGNNAETEKMLSHVSGKAHEMIQKRIDGQAFIYMSNFAKAVRRCGEVWLSMAKDVYVESGRNMKTIDTMGQMGTVKLGEPGLSDTGAVVDKNDITKATFDVAVDVGPSSASQREATVKSLTGMMAVAQEPQDARVLQAMALYNMEGEGLNEAREYFRKQLVQMGVLPPNEEEKAQMEAEAQKPNPQEEYFLAEANKANAQAEKVRAEIQKVLSEVELNQAKTAETYSDVDVRNIQQVQDLIRQEQEAVAAQQQAVQQALAAANAQRGPVGAPPTPGLTPR